MKRVILGIVAGSLLLASSANAQVVLSGGTVRLGNGQVLEKGDVAIDVDGKIAAVGETVATPAGWKVVDVSGKVVTPGFIDVGTQLGLVEIWAVERSRDTDPGAIDDERDVNRAAFRAADAFNPFAVAIPETRVNGVTSVIALPGGGLISGQAAYVELMADFGHGQVVRENVGVVASIGGNGSGSRGGSLLRLREALEDARYWRDNKRRVDENRARALAPSRLDSAALAEVLDGNPLMLRVDRASDILAALELAREFSLDLVLLGADEGWMVAEKIASAKVPVVVRPMDNLPTSFDSLGTRADNAALLSKAGVAVSLSTFEAHNVRNLRYYAGNAVRDGMGHTEALTAVTKNAAQVAGVADQVGTLEVGKAGNVVVWSADPFEISTAVESVWIGGKRVPEKTRQRVLFERYRSLERRGTPAEREVKKSDDGDREADQIGGKDVEQNDRAR